MITKTTTASVNRDVSFYYVNEWQLHTAKLLLFTELCGIMHRNFKRITLTSLRNEKTAAVNHVISERDLKVLWERSHTALRIMCQMRIRLQTNSSSLSEASQLNLWEMGIPSYWHCISPVFQNDHVWAIFVCGDYFFSFQAA